MSTIVVLHLETFTVLTHSQCPFTLLWSVYLYSFLYSIIIYLLHTIKKSLNYVMTYVLFPIALLTPKITAQFRQLDSNPYKVPTTGGNCYHWCEYFRKTQQFLQSNTQLQWIMSVTKKVQQKVTYNCPCRFTTMFYASVTFHQVYAWIFNCVLLFCPFHRWSKGFINYDENSPLFP